MDPDSDVTACCYTKGPSPVNKKHITVMFAKHADWTVVSRTVQH